MGRGPLQVCVALGVTGWVGFSRITRGETLRIRELEFVQAARALGASTPRILLTHVLPNLAHLVLITFVLMFSGLVLSEALLLALLGAAIGLALGQGLTALLGWELARARSLHVSGAWGSWQQAWLVAGTLLLALVAAALPAWRALRLDVSRLMQAPR